MTVEIFSCKCKARKTTLLTLDGGVCGIYELELCKSCYLKHDKKFLIKEERLI